MQGGLDEFLAARERDKDDNNADDEYGDNGPEIAVGSRAPSRVASGAAAGAASIAASSIGAASLGVQFRATRRTLDELNRGEVIARKQDRGSKGSKTYISIRKAATTPLPNKLLGPRFLGAKNKDGELLNRSKTIQEDYLSNLQALKPIITQMVHYDLKGVLLVPSVYDDHGFTYEDRWNLHSPDFTTIDISQHWNQVTMSHCENWQRDLNDHAVDEDYESSIWVRELLEGCLDSELQKQVKDKYDRLDAYQKGGITYFKILVDTVFKMSSLTVKSLKQFIADFGKDGLSKVQGENVRHIGTLIIAVATRLSDCNNLGFESYQHVVDGLGKCNVAKFRKVYQQKSAALTFDDALYGYGDMASADVLSKIENVLHPAMNIYDNLNLGGQWHVPGKSVNSLPIACDNCGGPHVATKCPLPHNEEKCKKAREARLKANAEAGRGGRGGRGGGRGGRGSGRGDKRGQWSSSDDSAKTAVAQGVECINNVWMMKCKDCGWNTSHTTKYCEEAKRNGASFAVPATHPYWALSKKAHPSATAAGSATVGTGSNDGSSSTLSSRMSTFIDNRMTTTENADMASLLADLKSCLQGN